MAAGVGVAVAIGRIGRERPHGPSRAGHIWTRRDGVLVLPLSGTVSASPSRWRWPRHTGSTRPGPASAFNGARRGCQPPRRRRRHRPAECLASVHDAPASGPIDVAPSATSVAAAPLRPHLARRRAGHRVRQPGAGSTPPRTVSARRPPAPRRPGDRAGIGAGSSAATPRPSGPSARVRPCSGARVRHSRRPVGAVAGPRSCPAPIGGCLTTTQLTLEVSDTAAVGTVTEPLFSGATGALVDVQIGEIGSAEGAPATWVMAQVGTGAATVEVQFADGTIDHAAVPVRRASSCSGTKGAPADALGNGSVAAIDVLDASRHGAGRLRARHRRARCRSTATPRADCRRRARSNPPTPAAATAAVSRGRGDRAGMLRLAPAAAPGGGAAVTPSRSCRRFGGQRGGERRQGRVHLGHRPPWSQYHLDAAEQGQQQTGPLYAAATLSGAHVAAVAGLGGAGDPGDAGQPGGQRHGRAGRAAVRAQLARRHGGGGVQGAARIAVGPGVRHRRGRVHARRGRRRGGHDARTRWACSARRCSRTTPPR